MSYYESLTSQGEGGEVFSGFKVAFSSMQRTGTVWIA